MEFINEQTMKNEIGIYKISNLVSGRVYVGQTKERFQRRYWLHQWELRNGCHDNKYLQNAWNKYGEDNFTFEVIEILPREEIDERERYWIAYYRENGGCYCIQDGGQPTNIGRYVSPEARKRVGEMNRQRMLGSKLSEKTKQKMSEIRTGKHPIRKNDLMTEDEARTVKEMLVAGYSSGDIVKTTGVPYKGINSIISNNNYAAIKVDGWDEYIANRMKSVKHRLTKEQILQLVEDSKNGMSNEELAKKYNIVISEHILENDVFEIWHLYNTENKYGDKVTKLKLLGIYDGENEELFYEITVEKPSDKFSFTLIIGEPSVTRSSRKDISIYVNGRKIQEYSLIQAIVYGTQGYFPNGSFPVACLFVQIDSSLVDFNIHPAKKEARFKDINPIHHQLQWNS